MERHGVVPLSRAICSIFEVSSGRKRGEITFMQLWYSNVFYPLTMVAYACAQDISWISLHTAGKAIIEMRDSPIPILHLVNPHPVSWSVLLKPIANELSVPLVPYAEWLRRLEKGFTERENADKEDAMHYSKDHPEDNPALPLIHYFRVAANRETFGFSHVGVEHAAQISHSLRNAEMLTPEDALKWVQWWKQEGHM
jgi:hypothetical protein